MRYIVTVLCRCVIFANLLRIRAALLLRAGLVFTVGY